MARMFSYESSEVDWCEDNYRHSETVAEYFNTMSNIVFFVVAPIMLYLLHPYAKERNLAVHLVWIMMIFFPKSHYDICPLAYCPTYYAVKTFLGRIGLFSMYFHMTLSLMGQLLDELSILWVIAIGYSLWFPRKHFPFFIKNRSTFSWMVLAITAITTVSSLVKPAANAYALNFFAVHVVYSVTVEMRSCTNPRVLRLARQAIGLWVLAISCWISDRFGCSFWKKINFCYLHAIWHILIVIVTAYGSSLLSYLDALYELPNSQPVLQYWPCESWDVGLPYVIFKGPNKTKKCC